MKRKRLVASALPALLFATTAYAVRQPDYLAERPLETAQGSGARPMRHATMIAPTKAAAALRAFTDAHGAWTAQWDADTGVPTWLYGQGIAAPGAMADDAIAERAARAVLTEAIQLLAPGATVDDFTMTRTIARNGLRTVAFQQTWNGYDVWGGHLVFLFKNDRLFAINTTASPTVNAAIPSTTATDFSKAIGWIDGLYGAPPKHLATGAAVVLPIVDDRGGLSHRVVLPITLDLESPRAQWTVFVDAGTGDPIARHQRLQFASGAIRYKVPVRWPGGDHVEYPATFATHKIDGTTDVTSDGDGNFTWAAAGDAAVTPGLRGPKVRVSTATGVAATTSLTVSETTGAVWDLGSDEKGDAQLTAFIHANIAKAYIKANMDPDLPWLDAQMPVRVNEDDVCNAYSNLDDIHFFTAGSQGNTTCENTGRLADVVYHETGHSIHCQAMQDRLGINCETSFDSGLSEGVSDYLAATITDDPAMGIGFFQGSGGPLRHIDPPGSEMRYPEDVSDQDPHVTGEIIAGALWDVRKALIAAMGETDGVALADDIYYGIISSGVDLLGSFPAALAVDDDDGDLSNGTPHECAITEAFRAHGLTEVPGAPGSLAPPTLDDLTIRIAQPDSSGSECPAPGVESATATWRLRSDPTVTGTVELTAGTGELVGELPAPEVDGVIEYQVSATLEDGMVKRYPVNMADGWYQTYVGEVTTLYCTDFENAPDDWSLVGQFEWGAATASAGSGDPASAYSGTSILSQVLGGNYEASSSSSAISPVIDTQGYANIHVQYRRWLGTEDAEYDDATITVDGAQVWNNLRTTDGDAQHVDLEWRFHDVDVSDQAADGSIQVTFEHTSDQGLEFSGWQVDDFCVVAVPVGDNACAEGQVEVDGECVDETNPDGGCCSTGDDGAPVAPLALGAMTFAGLALRRRRRRS